MSALENILNLHKLCGVDGFRSIGPWTFGSTKEELKEVLFRAEFNEPRLEHLDAILAVDGYAVIMEEKYDPTYRIHSLGSFAYFLLVNVEGSKFNNWKNNNQVPKSPLTKEQIIKESKFIQEIYKEARLLNMKILYDPYVIV